VPIRCQPAAELLGLFMGKNKSAYPYREAILSDSKGDISKKWYVNYYAWSQQKGILVRKRVVINQATAKERYKYAQGVIEIINHELENGAIVDPIPVPEPEISPLTPLKDACTFFLTRKGMTAGKNTIRTYKKDVKAFTDWLELDGMGNLPLSHFGINEAYAFSDYLDGRVSKKTGRTGIAKKTYSNIIGTMRTMWTLLIDREVLSDNPFLKLQKRKGGRSQHVPYTPEQVKVFKRICLKEVGDEQLWLFVNFMYYCFLRPREEAQKLRIKHILKKTIVVPGELAKNDDTEHVRIPKGLEVLIEKYKLRSFPPNHYVFSLDGQPGTKPVNDKYMYAHNKKILKLAGLTDQEYDLYGWKHTGVISLYQATKDIKLVQVQCRHKDISTTDIYLRDLGLFLDEDALDCFPDPAND
jgi:integrase